MNILITNIGRRTYLVDFLQDLKKKYKKIKIFVSDPNQHASGMMFNDNVKKIKTPKSKHKQIYIKKLIGISKKNKIELIIPASDYELELLSRNVKKFNNHNAKILISDYKTIKICNNKLLMNKFCLKNKILTPKIIKFKKLTNDIIIKPIHGSGSKNIIQKSKYIKINKISKQEFIFQKKILGDEYGVDILNDINGNFVSACKKKKILMRSGETDQAKIIFSKKILNFSKRISKALKHKGNLDCDLIVSKRNNSIYLIDLNPRFGGGYAFTHKYGLNYLKFIIEENFGFKKSKLFSKNKKKIFSKGISIK